MGAHAEEDARELQRLLRTIVAVAIFADVSGLQYINAVVMFERVDGGVRQGAEFLDCHERCIFFCHG